MSGPRPPIDKHALVIMAKTPDHGRVKTRLASVVGDVAATELYTAFLADLAARFAAVPFRVVWAVDPPGGNLGPAVAGGGFEFVGQVGDGLGDRMQRTFVGLFDGGTQRVVMIGSDVPHIEHSAIDGAFAALAYNDVVLVPSRDGGYCLIGLSGPHDLFSSIAMSTALVLEQTRDLARQRGLSVELLEATFDVDEIDDVRRLEDFCRMHPGSCPHTERILTRWRSRGLLTEH